FIAIAGIDPATSAAGNMRLAIFGDDRALVETEVTGDQPPQPIHLDIANVKRIKIVVDYGQNLDTGDWLNLCDARIAKRAISTHQDESQIANGDELGAERPFTIC